RVVTASEDGTARVWEAATGRPVSPPLRHRDGVARAGFSPEGERVVTASADGTAQVWEAATGRRLFAPFLHSGPVHYASFSAHGTPNLGASGGCPGARGGGGRGPAAGPAARAGRGDLPGGVQRGRPARADRRPGRDGARLGCGDALRQRRTAPPRYRAARQSHQ